MRGLPWTWSTPPPKLVSGRLNDTVASASGFSVTGPVAAAELMTAEPSGDVAAAPRSPVLASTTSAGTAIRA